MGAVQTVNLGFVDRDWRRLGRFFFDEQVFLLGVVVEDLRHLVQQNFARTGFGELLATELLFVRLAVDLLQVVLLGFLLETSSERCWLPRWPHGVDFFLLYLNDLSLFFLHHGD